MRKNKKGKMIFGFNQNIKKCSKCKIEKNLDCFDRNKTKPPQYRDSACKACRSTYKRNRYLSKKNEARDKVLDEETMVVHSVNTLEEIEENSTLRLLAELKKRV